MKRTRRQVKVKCCSPKRAGSSKVKPKESSDDSNKICKLSNEDGVIIKIDVKTEPEDDDMAEPEIEPFPVVWTSSDPLKLDDRPLTGLQANITPGTKRRKQELESVYVGQFEQAAALDLDLDDEDTINEHYDDVRQWISELSTPQCLPDTSRPCRTAAADVDSDSPGTDEEKAPQPDSSRGVSGSPSATRDVVPSESGRTATQNRAIETVDEGSELDSDCDDELNLDKPAAIGGMSRTIADDEELDRPLTRIINSIESAIDQLDGIPKDFEWSQGFDSFRGEPEVFSGPTPGPIEDYDTPYDAFTAIWGKDIIEHIVTETNRYAKQVVDALTAAGKISKTSRLLRWTDTNEDEMYMFFAILMFMGLDPRTTQQDYWRTTGYLGMSKFRQLMQYNRFILFNKFLHFQNNSASSQDLTQFEENFVPKLRKIAPIIGHLNNKFAALYNLHPEIVIDESLTQFKGRSSWIEAITSKSVRIGTKSSEVFDAKTGYLYKFDVYTSKDGSHRHAFTGTTLAEKSVKVVIDLLKSLEKRGHCVTMDSFYNCPALARYLKSLGFDCLGKMRLDRKNVPSDIKNFPANVARGTIIARHCGDVSCIAWKDTKVVTLISTHHKPETYVGRKGSSILVKPVVVRDYNNIMGGIDLKDQNLSSYLREDRKCTKWYVRMFKRLLNVSLLNAYILLSGSLKRRNKPAITHRQFREQLVNSLVDKHFSFPEVISTSLENSRLRRDVVHVPKYHGRNNRKRCVICNRIGKNKLVSTQCVTCNEFMCFENCWLHWHSLQQLPGVDKLRRERIRRQ